MDSGNTVLSLIKRDDKKCPLNMNTFSNSDGQY